MKNAIIIHGMPYKEEYDDPHIPASSERHWLPWLREELKLRGIAAVTPEMPIPYNPEYQAWKNVFEQYPLSEETILVGHSCGAGFIIRYLSENNVKVGKVVLVAPWLDPEKSLDTGMFDFTIDTDLLSKVARLVIFSSTDDMEEVQESVAILKAKIPAIQVVEFKDYGHFCVEDMGTEAFPELLEEVIGK